MPTRCDSERPGSAGPDGDGATSRRARLRRSALWMSRRSSAATPLAVLLGGLVDEEVTLVLVGALADPGPLGRRRS